jgi:hypothetical protein
MVIYQQTLWYDDNSKFLEKYFMFIMICLQKHDDNFSYFQKLSPQDTLLQEFNPEERSTLLRAPAANNLEDLKLFVKVCRYFNGKYHLVIE